MNACLPLLLLVVQVLAITWSAGKDGTWTDPNNWTPSRLPRLDDDVEISTCKAILFHSQL
jgi:hypothetical protein